MTVTSDILSLSKYINIHINILCDMIKQDVFLYVQKLSFASRVTVKQDVFSYIQNPYLALRVTIEQDVLLCTQKSFASTFVEEEIATFPI